VHGSNVKNLSIATLISTSKNTIFFLLLLMSTVQQNWRKGQNRSCLEAREIGERKREWGTGGRNDPNNVFPYE
jgi:hypothetical protein